MREISSTPLATKLGLGEGATFAVLHAPDDFSIDLPSGVLTRMSARGRCDVVLAFYVRRSDLSRRIEMLSRRIYPQGSLWVAWPKRSSGVASDITDQTVREVALSLGLVDNKVCALDETWTALRLVWRRSRRSSVLSEQRASRSARTTP